MHTDHSLTLTYGAAYEPVAGTESERVAGERTGSSAGDAASGSAEEAPTAVQVAVRVGQPVFDGESRIV